MQHALLDNMAVSCHSPPGLEYFGQPAQPGALQLLGHPGSATLLVFSHLPAGHTYKATLQQLHIAMHSPTCRSGRPLAVHMLHKQPASGPSTIHLRRGLTCLIFHKKAVCRLDASGSCLLMMDPPACWARHCGSPLSASQIQAAGSHLAASHICSLRLVAP